jgi:hypothetical protein
VKKLGAQCSPLLNILSEYLISGGYTIDRSIDLLFSLAFFKISSFSDFAVHWQWIALNSHKFWKFLYHSIRIYQEFVLFAQGSTQSQ